MKGLDSLTNLQALILGENQIEIIQGIDNLKSLKMIDLSDNQISYLGDLEVLSMIESVGIHRNPIRTEELNKLLNYKNIKIDMDIDMEKKDTLTQLSTNKTTTLKRKNLTHIILQEFYKKSECDWDHFIKDPLNIPQSTLSNYLWRFQQKGYIKKIVRGHYRFTSKGKRYYKKLLITNEEERTLNYPPKHISKISNSEHIILWMAYHNMYLKWSDLLDDKAPVFINQSALSKNINVLLKKDLIRKNENKEYRITRKGKREYSRILKH
ncbi:MAG: leucine-rich repeat domain-containing protein [Candidatus Hodarchaeales archaeon]|jgi:predicted transcriptional regulator